MRKLDSLILLRAVAVILVCMCHFGNPLESKSIIGSVFSYFYEYGRYGVHIFFVVSGFIIPLSLKKADYSEGDYLRFLWKRMLRLHPPYVFALVLTLLTMYFSYKTRGLSSPETVGSAVKSFFYGHIPADNPVYWTLAVEAQYYIFIGIVYLYINKQPAWAVPSLITASIILHQSQADQYIIFFAYFMYFLIGIIGFLIYTKLGLVTANYGGIITLLIYTCLFDKVPASVAAFIAIVFILWYQSPVPPAVLLFGEISYSLYLIHFPIGIKFINLMNRYVHSSYNWILFVLALVIVSILSWIFYRFIEKPFADFSTRIKYGPRLDPVLLGSGGYTRKQTADL